MQHVAIKGIEISRFIVGSNPFSGFSHQLPETDLAMKRYFTTDRIKETLREAESLGVNTLIARMDYHIMRLLLEYWDEGGKLQWFAQTCPEVGSHEACVARATSGGAKACHIHGGVMDHLLAQGRTSEIPPVVDMIRQNGMLAGIAGHNPKVFEWAEENLDVDYYMCSYYNSAHRDEEAGHVSGMTEWFLEDDRRIMTGLIRTLSRPVIHYKILAAGRNDPKEAFEYAAGAMRPTDAVCVGICQKDKPDMFKEDVGLLEESLSGCGR
ncbi:MAG: hypothetical protein Q7T82_09860 [Armatimonadota bacterium]|nr:hypothetical protein [Armatimonadota bacterium]